MVDIALESFRAAVLLGIVLFLLKTGRGRVKLFGIGWNLIIAGFSLLLFASLLDITDNFESLNRYVVIGDTEVEAFLEKFVGFLGGFILLALGLVRWIPGIQRLSEEATQRKRAENSLQDSEVKFRDFAASSSDWFWEMDENLRFTYFSERFTEITGVSQDSLLGKTRKETGIPCVDEEAWRQHLADLAAHRPFREFRHPREHSKRGTVFLSINGKPVFDKAGKFRGYRGTGTDITERKQAEAALKLAHDELELRVKELRSTQDSLLRSERLAAMGQLTGTVAHELRNPLGSIAISAGVIQHRCSDMNLGLESALERIDRNIKRCDTIITELLDFARARGLQPKPTALDGWLSSVLEEQYIPGGITVECKQQTNGAVVNIDPDELHRAVINVINNACQAMTNEGSEENTTAKGQLTVVTRTNGKRLEIEIADTGPGIPENVMPLVLEPLFSTKSFGTGLGLPTAQRIMNEHGGGLEVSSEEGHGTQIVLWLPRCEGSEEELKG